MYQLTEEGRDTANTWLSTMLRTVKNEFPEFPAALSFIPLMSADDARRSCRRGCSAWARRSRRCESMAEDLREKYQLPRLFAIEDEYRLAMLEAEHAWVSGILDDLASGELYWDTATIRDWAEGLRRPDGLVPRYCRGRPAPTPICRPRPVETISRGRRCAANTPPARRPAKPAPHRESGDDRVRPSRPGPA